MTSVSRKADNPVASLPAPAQMGKTIFSERESIRRRTDDKIKAFVGVTLILIGAGAMIAAAVLLHGGGMPLAVAFMPAGGFVVMLVGISVLLAKSISEDEEEKKQQFWNSVSVDSLSELTRKQGAYYRRRKGEFDKTMGRPVKGVCGITYEELRDNGLMSPESAKKLETLLDANKKLEDDENQELCALEKMDKDLVGSDAENRIKAKYIEQKTKLQSEFETFRKAFIEETYQKFWKQ